MDEYNIKELIILCNNLEKYLDFKNQINGLKPYTSLAKLEMVMSGKYFFNNKQYKQFYKNNKEIINQYQKSGILNLIFNINSLEPIYNYIVKNKDKLDNILAILVKLLELGLEEIYFNEEYIYNDEVYEIDNYMNEDLIITYLDNIEILPSFDPYTIRYTTKGSKFKIIINGLDKIVELSDLTFSPDKIPDNLTYEVVFNKILSLSKNNKSNTGLEDIMNMHSGYEILNHSTNEVMEVFRCIGDVESREELFKLLNGIRSNVLKIKDVTKKYEDKIISNDGMLTKDELIRIRGLCKK